MSVRRATPEDAAALFALVSGFATSFTPEREAFDAGLYAALADARSILLVAEVDGLVVGHVLASVHPTLFANGELCWVEELMVEPAQREQGIGRALMAAVEEWAGERGCPYVSLATRRAGAFYEALGYEASASFYRRLLPSAANGP